VRHRVTRHQVLPQNADIAFAAKCRQAFCRADAGAADRVALASSSTYRPKFSGSRFPFGSTPFIAWGVLAIADHNNAPGSRPMLHGW
jgi:hypothetical protein